MQSITPTSLMLSIPISVSPYQNIHPDTCDVKSKLS